MFGHAGRTRRSVAPASAGYAAVVLLGFLVATLGIGAIGGAVTRPAMVEWYPSLAKPGFTPPDWIFGPVWTGLYVLMAIAAWLVWRAEGEEAEQQAALRAFWVQLALNVTWSWIFFRARDLGWAVVEILILLAAIAICVRRFWRLSPTAGALMIPYFAWTGFATVLTLGIMQLNMHR